MVYVDGFVLVVKKKNLNKYKKMASEAGKMWKKYGALHYVEAVGDDLHPNTHGMKQLGFSKLAELKKGETVFFSFITYKSKKHRNSVNSKVMKEFEKEKKKNPDSMKDMPWDMKRFSWGGFTSVVSL